MQSSCCLCGIHYWRRLLFRAIITLRTALTNKSISTPTFHGIACALGLPTDVNTPTDANTSWRWSRRNTNSTSRTDDGHRPQLVHELCPPFYHRLATPASPHQDFEQERNHQWRTRTSQPVSHEIKTTVIPAQCGPCETRNCETAKCPH